MNYIVQFGTSYYLVLDNGQRFELSFPQYQALMELDQGLVKESELAGRIMYYEDKQTLVTCPLCNEGLIPLGTVEYLDRSEESDRQQYHSMLYHQKEESDWIPFDGRPMTGPERTPKDFIGL